MMTQGNWTEARRRGSDQAQVFRGIPRLRVPTAAPSIPLAASVYHHWRSRARSYECGPGGYIQAHLGAILLCESDGGSSHVETACQATMAEGKLMAPDQTTW